MAGSNHLVLVVPMHDYISLYKLVGKGHFTALILLAGIDIEIKHISNFNIDSDRIKHLNPSIIDDDHS